MHTKFAYGRWHTSPGIPDFSRCQEKVSKFTTTTMIACTVLLVGFYPWHKLDGCDGRIFKELYQRLEAAGEEHNQKRPETGQPPDCCPVSTTAGNISQLIQHGHFSLASLGKTKG